MTVESIREFVSAFPPEWVAAVTALFAVFLSPLVSYWIARRQINAQVISVNRQEWINTLRDYVAEFLNLTAFLKGLEPVPPVTPSMLGGSVDEREEAQLVRESNAIESERLERIHLALAKINLLLNPKEKDHQDLVKLLNDSLSATREHLSNREAVVHYRRKEIIALSQKILKKEWERVKRGD